MIRKISGLTMLLATLGAGPALAEGPIRSLKDRIKSVSSKLYAKSGRLELTLYPLTSVSLNDAFYQKYGGGLGLTYHLTEGLSLGVMGTYSLNMETSNAAYYGRNDEFIIPYAGKRTFLASLDVMWAPVYGKISLAAEWILHFDTYLIGGLGAIGGEQTDDERSFGLAASFGLGIRLFATRMLAIRAELKDYLLFNDKVTYGNQERSDVQHQLLFNLGLSLFFLEGDAED